MKYFKVFFKKSNPEFQGQIVYKNILFHSSWDFIYTFSQPLHRENWKYIGYVYLILSTRLQISIQKAKLN